VAFKKPKDSSLTDLQQQFNKAHNSTRAIGERGDAPLKMTFKVLRNVSLSPLAHWCHRRRSLVRLRFGHPNRVIIISDHTVARSGSLSRLGAPRHSQRR
jgi:hypothetical protein